MTTPKLVIAPIRQKDAFAFVTQYHRHHRPPIGSIFQIACHLGTELVGVAICGRPVSRQLDDGTTIEVSRLCTNGTPHAASKLYAAAWRAARALGYTRCVTYILATETGTSLRAAGWRLVGCCPQRSWNRPHRPRTDNHPIQAKKRYEPDPALTA
jgi:hypothetical protein